VSGASLPSITDVLLAAGRLEGRVHRTRLELACSLGSAGYEVLLKLENQQRTGSFKVRGAVNAIAALPPAQQRRPLVTASAGNHGLGVALSASLLGIGATIFVPEGAAAIKRRRIERFGAELRRVAGSYDDAHAEAMAHAARTGATYVHAFSDPAVVAGQGTVGLEILRERPDVRTLLVPVGGGGLVGGIGLVARALAPEARVIGVQSTHTAAMHRSLAAGAVTSVPNVDTLCDGLAGDIDSRSLALAAEVVDEVRLVDEAAVRAAIRHLYLEEGLVAEGSAAVVAALLLEEGPESVAELQGPVAAVISGGNLDAAVLASILSARHDV
jgi:threonine dehydratase